jgi:hypothetical protein
MRKIHTLLLTGLAGCVASLPAQITIGENLDVSGFIDMSTTTSDAGGSSTDTLSLDQWEIDFNFSPSEGLSAQVDLNDTGDGAEVEQAFVMLDLGQGLALKAGLMLTPLGYEAAEPTGLYQSSVSATIIGYPGYANGIAAMYGNDLGSLYLAVVDASYSGDKDAEDLSFEAQLKLSPMEGLTLQAGYASEKFGSTEATGVTGDANFADAVGSYDQGIANFWAEYATGPITLAAEYNSLFEIGAPNADGDGYLVMLNYALTDKMAVTFRHSSVELDTGFENTEFTISPSYAVSDNLLTLLEFRTDEYDDSTQDGETIAAEMLFTF